MAEQLPEFGSKVGSNYEFVLHPGQAKAFRSEKRFVVVLAGTQSGKTLMGSLWLYYEIQKRGPGDYMVVTPTYPLLAKKALPEFLRLFYRKMRLGTYNRTEKVFTFSEAGAKRMWGKATDTETKIFFCYATDPESLESATAKGAWLDEAGQSKFKHESWEAIQRRVAKNVGRVLITSTPYCWNWLKTQMYDPWVKARRKHPEIDVINFRSIDNPTYPKSEFDRIRKTMPSWRFRMFYCGEFTRPAGLIYDCFDPERHTLPRFDIPPEWRRFLGLDFGGVNTAGVFLAEERDGNTPTGRLIAYKEYHAGNRTAAEHCWYLLDGEPRIPWCAGGSRSEGQWRAEFKAGGTVRGRRVPGIPIVGPGKGENDAAVEVGIQRVYAQINLGNLVFFDDLTGLLEELTTYSRELDEDGNPTERIADKSTFHLCDSLRYILGNLNRDQKPKLIGYKGPVARPGLQNL